MEEMNDILNPPDEKNETTPAEETAVSVETQESDEQEQTTGETTQVAAETDAESVTDQVRAELAALTKERERLRQKEAAFEEEKARFTAGTTETDTQEASTEAKDPRAEMKDLRKQYRTALSNSILDPEDEEAAKLVEELDDRMEELRVSMVNQAQQATSDQEKLVNEFRTTYAEVHKKYPFLAPQHPQADADLNEDINSYMAGRMQRGDSNAVALKKAVDLFAPAYKERLGIDTAEETEVESRKVEADKLIKEKLSKGGFSEVRSVGRSAQGKFSGPTPMAAILGKT